MGNERAGQPKYGPITEDEVNAFRSTKEGALSYFIAGNPNFPEGREDAGVPAVQRWQVAALHSQIRTAV